MNNFNEEKKSALTVGALVSVAAAVLIGGCLVKDCQDRKVRERYAAFPLTNVVAEAGQTVDMLTGRYVDKDVFPAEPVRRDQFSKDNSVRDVQKIRVHESYNIRCDPEYMAKNGLN